MPCTATVTIRLELADHGNRQADDFRQAVETEVLRHLVLLRGWFDGRQISFANPQPYLRIDVDEM